VLKRSPVSMELSQTTDQGFNHTEARPWVLTNLVDLLLREMLEVGVGGHKETEARSQVSVPLRSIRFPAVRVA
jgi:hypothetical protein